MPDAADASVGGHLCKHFHFIDVYYFICLYLCTIERHPENSCIGFFHLNIEEEDKKVYKAVQLKLVYPVFI